MAIADTISGEHAELILSDRFVFSDSSDFRKRLYRLLESNIRQLDINLSSLRFMDSAGLGMLMIVDKECKSRNISLRLVKPQAEVKNLLDLTMSYERFTIVE